MGFFAEGFLGVVFFVEVLDAADFFAAVLVAVFSAAGFFAAGFFGAAVPALVADVRFRSCS